MHMKFISSLSQSLAVLCVCVSQYTSPGFRKDHREKPHHCGQEVNNQAFAKVIYRLSQFEKCLFIALFYSIKYYLERDSLQCVGLN